MNTSDQTERARPAPLPTSAAGCPTWCALPAQHGAYAVPDRVGTRYIDHSAPVLVEAGGRSIDLRESTVVSAGGTVASGPVEIVIDNDPVSGLSVEGARHLAAAFALAAELATGGGAR